MKRLSALLCITTMLIMTSCGSKQNKIDFNKTKTVDFMYGVTFDLPEAMECFEEDDLTKGYKYSGHDPIQDIYVHVWLRPFKGGITDFKRTGEQIGEWYISKDTDNTINAEIYYAIDSLPEGLPNSDIYEELNEQYWHNEMYGSVFIIMTQYGFSKDELNKVFDIIKESLDTSNVNVTYYIDN